MKYTERQLDQAVTGYVLALGAASAGMGFSGRWPADYAALGAIACVIVALVLRAMTRITPPIEIDAPGSGSSSGAPRR